MIKRKNKKDKKRYTRKIQRGGVILKYFPGGPGWPEANVPLERNIVTFGDLKAFHKRQGQGIYPHRDNNYVLKEGDVITHVFDIIPPRRLFDILLNDPNQDYKNLSRKHRKFAACLNGGGFNPYSICIEYYYTSEEMELFLDLFSRHYKYPIGYTRSGILTIYDIDAANILLDSFHSVGIYKGIRNIKQFYNDITYEDPNFMHFIHILFGEIRVGGKKLAKRAFASNDDIVNFESLPEKIKDVVSIFYTATDPD